MGRRGLIALIISLVGGIALGDRLNLSLWFSLIPLSIAIIVFVISILVRRRLFTGRYFFNESIGSLIFLGIGILSAGNNRPAQREFPEDDYTFAGRVLDYNLTGQGDKVLVSLDRLVSNGGEEISVRNVNALITIGDATNLSYGYVINGKAHLQPFNAKGNYLKEDYEKYLASQHIFLTGRLFLSNYNIEKGSNFFLSYFKDLRNDLEIGIEKTELNPDTKSFLISVLLGDKSYIRTDERLVFSDAGISHIFAVSGFHVSMIALFLTGLLSVIFIRDLRRFKYLLVIPLIWFYILLVGASPATIRAGIMITVAMTAIFLQRKYKPIQALGWAILIILSFSSVALYDIGFQLSVVCVGSIIFISQPLNFIDHRRHPRTFKAVSVALVTLTATFSSWLICAFYFHRFSLMFLPINLLAVPLLPLFLAGAIVYLLLFHLGITFTFWGILLDSCYNVFIKGTEWVTSLSNTITDLHPGIFSILIWMMGLASLGFLLNKEGLKKKQLYRYLSIPAGLFVISIFILLVDTQPSPQGFIIQRNNRETSIISYTDRKENQLVLPEGNSVTCKVNGKSIFTLRSENINEEIAEALSHADYILICKGCREIPEEVFETKKPSAKIVTHPTLHWRYERNMLAAATERDVKIHSLRYDGPLHVFDSPLK